MGEHDNTLGITQTYEVTSGVWHGVFSDDTEAYVELKFTIELEDGYEMPKLVEQFDAVVAEMRKRLGL